MFDSTKSMVYAENYFSFNYIFFFDDIQMSSKLLYFTVLLVYGSIMKLQ